MDYQKEHGSDWDNLLSQVWGSIPDDETDWKQYFKKEFIREFYEVLQKEGLIKDGDIYAIVNGKLLDIRKVSNDYWLQSETGMLQNLDNEEKRQFYQREFDSDIAELSLKGHHEITIQAVKEAILSSFDDLHKNYIFSHELHLYRGFQNEIHYRLFVKYCTSLAYLMMENEGVVYADMYSKRIFNTDIPVRESMIEVSPIRAKLKYSRIRNRTLGIETSPADIVFLELIEPLYEHLKDIASLISLPTPPQQTETNKKHDDVPDAGGDPPPTPPQNSNNVSCSTKQAALFLKVISDNDKDDFFKKIFANNTVKYVEFAKHLKETYGIEVTGSTLEKECTYIGKGKFSKNDMKVRDALLKKFGFFEILVKENRIGRN